MVGAIAMGGRSSDRFYRMFALSTDLLQQCVEHVSLQDVRILRRPSNIRIDGLGVFDSVYGPLRTHFCFFQMRPEYWCIPLLNRQGFAVTHAHQKYIPAFELALTRAGPHCLERILVRIHVQATDQELFSVVPIAAGWYLSILRELGCRPLYLSLCLISY